MLLQLYVMLLSQWIHSPNCMTMLLIAQPAGQSMSLALDEGISSWVLVVQPALTSPSFRPGVGLPLQEGIIVSSQGTSLPAALLMDRPDITSFTSISAMPCRTPFARGLDSGFCNVATADDLSHVLVTRWARLLSARLISSVSGHPELQGGCQ